MRRLLRRGTRIVYCPVDAYVSEEHVRADEPFLRSCSAVLVHCARLLPLVRPFAAHAGLVEHHNKYGLAEPVPYRTTGPIVWVGGFQNVPFLLAWLQDKPLAKGLVLVTDFRNPAARRLASSTASRLGVELREDGGKLNGASLVEWSEESQRRVMSAARAAIDIKGEDFNQRTKPATKAQKFVASGIPLAVNGTSHSAEYFRQRGFTLASPDDPARWFSEEYWRETRSERERLLPELSLSTVCARYREHLSAIL